MLLLTQDHHQEEDDDLVGKKGDQPVLRNRKVKKIKKKLKALGDELGDDAGLDCYGSGSDLSESEYSASEVEGKPCVKRIGSVCVSAAAVVPLVPLVPLVPAAAHPRCCFGIGC